MRRRLPLIVLLLLLFAINVPGERQMYRNRSQNIALIPLQLDPAHPGPRRLGDLIFESAWELGSGNNDFGGISALTALPDGRFVGVSDAGTLIGFGLTSDDRTDRPFIAPLPGAFGSHISYKDRDSEGLVYDPATGRFWISYEGRHAIRRFTTSFARSDAIARPKEMQGWPSNRGGESIARLGDGRFVIFSEGGGERRDGEYQALLFSGDPVEPGTVVSSFWYRPPVDYRVTDATLLPDGRLLLLHRRIGLPDGFRAKLALLDPANIKPDSTLEGNVIATLAAPLLVDNMEGVAVTREGKKTIIWLISDNNFNIFERTLLMKFRLAERAKKKPEAVNAPGFESL